MEDRDLSSSKETKAPPETVSEDWSNLPWRKLEHHCYRLQKRIYRASERGKEASCPPTSAVIDALAVSPTAGGATGDARQPGQEDGRRRRNQIYRTGPTAGPGRSHS